MRVTMFRTVVPLAASLVLASAAQARSRSPVPATAPLPAATEALVDDVRGMTIDRAGHVSTFTGVLLTTAGRVVRLLGPEDKRPDRLAWRADMRGRIMLPGFVDAHGHVMELGLRALGLDLSAATSLADAQARIAAYAAANPDRKWIVGGGWDQEKWGLGRFPTAAELDAAVGDRPVWLTRGDGDAGWANTAAIRAAGVTARTAAPSGGRIERAGGQPAGVFVDAARELVDKVAPQPSAKDRDAAFLKAQQMLLAHGVTAIADMGSTLDDWLAYRRLGDAGALRVRVMSYASGVDTAVQVGGEGPTPWLYDDRLRMVGLNLRADGSLGARGAWLKAPYADAPRETGDGFMTDDVIRNRMSRAAMDGYQVAVDATGDRAIAQALAAIDEMAETYKGDRRWRIEGARAVDPADLPRFARDGIVASMQPARATGAWRTTEARLGVSGPGGTRLAGADAWATMLRQDVPLAFGSDSSAATPDLFAGWAAAFTRQGADGEPFGGWRPQERVTREQAWWALTGAGAYAGLAEKEFGSLQPGQMADFIIVDHDPMLASPTELRATKVEETWVGGRKMWEAEGVKGSSGS